jgi:hypothetical protein
VHRQERDVEADERQPERDPAEPSESFLPLISGKEVVAAGE